jgi:hypothetical protein
VKLYSSDGSEMMTVSTIERDGDNLVIKGKVFGAMPMSAKLTPDQAREALKLMSPQLVWFLLTLPFRGKTGDA